MSQIKTKNLTNVWIDFSTITTPVSNKMYFIQNRGPDILVACEGDSTPNKKGGLYVPPYCVLKYKLGSQYLYLKSFKNSCTINVSEEG